MNVSSRLWMTGKRSHEGNTAGFGRRTVFLLSHLAFAFCLTITYLGMRAILRLAESKRNRIQAGLAAAEQGAYKGWGRSVLLQLAAAALGIWLAILFFQSQTRPAKPGIPEKSSAAYACPKNRVTPAPAIMEES